MNSWRPYPLLRLVFPFLAGIIVEITCRSARVFGILPMAIMFLLLLSSQIFPRFSSIYRLRWISGLLVNLFLLMAGYEIAWYNRFSNDTDYIGRQPQGLFLACIAEPPAVSQKSIKAVLDVRYTFKSDRWVRTCGHALG